MFPSTSRARTPVPLNVNTRDRKSMSAELTFFMMPAFRFENVMCLFSFF